VRLDFPGAGKLVDNQIAVTFNQKIFDAGICGFLETNNESVIFGFIICRMGNKFIAFENGVGCSWMKENGAAG
jgi:hypothetical protein